MKMSPEYKKAQENMRPGILSAIGFLGNDKRLLIDIITEDEELLKKLDITFELIIEKMKYFEEKAKEGLGENIIIDEKWEVRSDEARGVLPCPFEDGVFRKINTFVKNISNGKSINYSELSIHLIEKHHFFQGKEAIFRIEPLLLKEIFEI